MSAVQQAGAAYVSPQYRMKGVMSVLNVTFWLQVALLASAAWSVQSAGWVESPPLVVIAFLAALAAYLMADLKGRASVYHVSSTFVGLVIAYLGGVFLTEADQWYLRFGELNSRLWEWWVAVFSKECRDGQPAALNDDDSAGLDGRVLHLLGVLQATECVGRSPYRWAQGL